MQSKPSASTEQVRNGPTAPVPKDPQPSVDRIDDLARRILVGDILLPKFQRSFVWERAQILDLLDSVAKNYPIGSVLLWQSRQDLRSQSHIADLNIKLPKPDYPVNYLLDGQQRLSCICGSLFWQGDDAASIWNIAFDLRQQAFVHLNSLDDPPLNQMPTRLLADPAVFFKRVSEIAGSALADKTVLKDRAERLFNRFKDYKLATVTLGDMPIADVAPIFERINSTGTKLTIVDLMRAATWSEEFDLVDSIDSVRELLAAKDFGDLDRKVLLRILAGMECGGYTASHIDNLRHRQSANLLTASGRLSDSVTRAVDFLSTELRIPTDAALPYANQFTVLADVFGQIPTPNAAQRQAIARWFWKTAASEYFGGWNTGEMATDYAAVRAFAAGKPSIAGNDTPLPNARIWAERAFRSNSALAKILALVLAYHEPRDLLTGARIDTGRSLSWSNYREFHHFFPKDFLRTQGYTMAKANVLANIIYLTSASNKSISARSPLEYLEASAKRAGGDFSLWLSSNLISTEAFAAAMNEDYPTFLRERARTIHSKLSALAEGNTPVDGLGG